MSVFKCKMCGGTIEFNLGDTVGICDSCGTKQTLPRLDDDKKANLYDRANHFRRNNEFDKAMGIYEQILNEDNTDAEAYWSLVLCRYGIEYVEDPATHKRVPTVNRAQYTSIFADEDYKSALKYADSYQRTIYEDEARAIDDIQKGILEISNKEEPFDVFICYKETDDSGRRTRDSVLANDLYHQLTQEGFKVFFSRITLENKLGTAYEPYIFAALNLAKVMVVLGTKPEYFNAVWVKNEWSRYLALVKVSKGKKMLIPAYKDMDPYDLPEEFSHLQAQDMSKLGFMQDLIRGIKKIIAADAPRKSERETVIVQQGGSTTANAQVQRGYMALEDNEWEKADGFFEEALNLDPKCAEAYIGKLLVRERKSDFDSWVTMQKEKYARASYKTLEACPEDTGHIDEAVKTLAIDGYLDDETIRAPYGYNRKYDSALSSRLNQKKEQLSGLSSDRLLTRAKQYADDKTQKWIDDGIAKITATLDKRITQAREQDTRSIERIKVAYAEHLAEADKKAHELNIDAQNSHEQDYQNALAMKNEAHDISDYEAAKKALQAMNGYKDSEALALQCDEGIVQIKEAERREIERREKERQEEAAKKRRKKTAIIFTAVIVCVAVVILLTQVIIPNNKYSNAVSLMNEGKYEEAIAAFEELDGYKDSTDQIENCYIICKIGEDKWNEIKSIKAGDTYTFGTYEQDNNTTNGKEEIEWTVLDRVGTRILVISSYALDCQPYNEEDADVTWENCTLRSWLNNDFYNAAFNDEEQLKIIHTYVTADKNPDYDTNPGNDTTDNIFLLSITEVKKYFSGKDARMCAPTEYAVAQGAYACDSYSVGGAATCWWWLRSSGFYQYFAASVQYDGSAYSHGNEVGIDFFGVRPALWIDLAS
jgi:tetratricopeptide (TPR) repeat protein/TolA-binding protein